MKLTDVKGYEEAAPKKKYFNARLDDQFDAYEYNGFNEAITQFEGLSVDGDEGALENIIEKTVQGSMLMRDLAKAIRSQLKKILIIRKGE